MESAYICIEGGSCGGLGTPNADGSYSMTVMVSDENGTAIPQQLEADGTTVVPLDNGSFQVVETDSNNIVTITPASSFSTPGTDRHALYGHNINIKCQNVGSTTIAAKLLPTDNSAGTVSGFTYTTSNYPQAGSILSTVGSDEYYGNSLAVNCSSTGSMTLQ